MERELKKVLHNLIEAHVQAYDTISTLDNTDADGDGVPKLVGFSHAMTFIKPAKLSVLGLPADNNEAAKNFDYFTNDYFLNAVINGEEDLNYLDTLQRHDKSSPNLIIHPGWKHKVDFVGLNYYRAIYVQYNPVVALSSARFVGGVPLNDLRLEAQPHGNLNDMGWEIFPEGLYSLIMRITNQWNLPILISENGIPDKSGANRSPFILSHISQVKRATDSGADVLGYIYWSLMDNYEWQDAYSPDSRFGLYQVNRNSPDFERIPTQAVDTLQFAITEYNGSWPSDSTISTNTVPKSPKPPIAETNEVSIATGSSNSEQGQGFAPPSIAVETDTTVTWTNNDDTLHTVTSGKPEGGNSGTEFDSSYLASGKKFQHDFISTGQYSYYCTAPSIYDWNGIRHGNYWVN